MHTRLRVALIVLVLLLAIGGPMALAQEPSPSPDRTPAPVGGTTLAANPAQGLTLWLPVAAAVLLCVLGLWLLLKERQPAE
jgi:hypothetical protein